MSRYDEKSKEYRRQYEKDKLKRIPLDVQLDEYQDIKRAAGAAGIGVNTWIKQVIREKLKAGDE